MGIYSRQYMQEGPRGGRFSFRAQMVTVQLILLNVAVFVLWQLARGDRSLAEFMMDNFTVSADGVLKEYRLHTLLTAAFSHRDFVHGLFNMLFLYWFGRDLEAIYGRKDFLLLYGLSGVIASVAHVALQLVRGSEIPALGASGAVMGIVVVYAFFYPSRLVYFYGLFPITVRWLAIAYVAMDLFGVLSPEGDGIAHAAHLGGALTGFLYYKLDLRFFGRRSGNGRGFQFRPPDKHEQRPGDAERLDAILEKIAREGMVSLTDSERRFLQEAGRRYRS